MGKDLEFISQYCKNLAFEKIPESTVREVKLRLIDSIGCAINAYAHEPSTTVRRLCFPTGAPLTARVIGSLMYTTLEMAAFANSTMVRSLDFNDVYHVKSPTHPSDGIAAVLAMGEALHSDGKSLITGIVLNYEMHVPFVERTPVGLGWDGCAITATLGSAVGAGKLLGLSKEQFANAVAFAVVPNNTLMMRIVGELSTYKELYAGMASRQGIFAALLAREGLTGPGESIGGSAGLEKMITGPMQWEPLGGDGVQYAIERTNIKKFPAIAQAQIFIKTAIELGKKLPVKDIKEIKIKTQSFGMITANSPELRMPKTKETADHSSIASVAIALLDGDVTPNSWIRERFLDEDVIELMCRIHVEEELEFTKEFPAKNHCLIEAVTNNGKTESVHTIVKGAVANDVWTDEDIEHRYIKLTNDILTPGQVSASLEVIWHLEDVKDVGLILDQLKI